MKIIFLNAWKYNIRGRVANFISEHASTTDVFCFQEAHQLEGNIAGILDGFSMLEVVEFFDDKRDFSLKSYIRRPLLGDGYEIIFSG